MSFEVTPESAGLSRYTPEQGRALCARVAAGESLRRIGAEAGWPSPQTAWKWAVAHPEFGEALSAAQRAARIGARLADRDRQLSRAARREPWRRGRPPMYGPALVEEICMRLSEGESLIAITRDPDMPCYRTVLKWARDKPEFADAYTEARRLQADHLADEAHEIVMASTHATVWSDRLRFAFIRWRAANLAPKKYAERVVVAETLRPPETAQGLTVIVKRYSEITPEEYARAEEGEP
ncbi:terminase small subunit-like protein [Phenylobacterium soli]|uniref:Terminase small subunit n=1 Tax=Phenylobacterium soli TaxID=2170551 RepID=A0A328AIS4_9CAUL|nr:hypothetical protein [Phenylobacterium soli]RAK54407.1 hypothetical protein DJ017_07665 [Phenylobacterium soli]